MLLGVLGVLSWVLGGPEVGLCLPLVLWLPSGASGVLSGQVCTREEGTAVSIESIISVHTCCSLLPPSGCSLLSSGGGWASSALRLCSLAQHLRAGGLRALSPALGVLGAWGVLGVQSCRSPLGSSVAVVEVWFLGVL